MEITMDITVRQFVQMLYGDFEILLMNNDALISAFRYVNGKVDNEKITYGKDHEEVRKPTDGELDLKINSIECDNDGYVLRINVRPRITVRELALLLDSWEEVDVYRNVKDGKGRETSEHAYTFSSGRGGNITESRCSNHVPTDKELGQTIKSIATTCDSLYVEVE